MQNKIFLIATGIFYPDIGGPASYGRLLGQELSSRFVVSLITYSSVFRDKDDKKLNFKVTRVWKKIPKIIRHGVYFIKAMALARKSDVVFALNAVSAGLPALMAAKLNHKKFFVKIVGDYAWEIAINKGKTFLLIDDFQKSEKRGFIKILQRIQFWVCKNADKVIVPSQYLAGIVAGWGVNPGKIEVVYNGVDFQPLDLSREEARKKIGIPGNVIISAGRLVPWKGFRMLIKIMPHLLKVNQFARLVIVGDGPERKTLEAIARNLGVDKKVYLIGKKSKDELRLFMAAADIFVLNTGYEGFSHQLLEAMSANVPVVTTAVGGNREIINQGENGFMVKYNDEFNLIEAIKTLWQSDELCREFVSSGKTTVSKFNSQKMLDETMAILEA